MGYLTAQQSAAASRRKKWNPETPGHSQILDLTSGDNSVQFFASSTVKVSLIGSSKGKVKKKKNHNKALLSRR